MSLTGRTFIFNDTVEINSIAFTSSSVLFLSAESDPYANHEFYGISTQWSSNIGNIFYYTESSLYYKSGVYDSWGGWAESDLKYKTITFISEPTTITQGAVTKTIEDVENWLSQNAFEILPGHNIVTSVNNSDYGTLVSNKTIASEGDTVTLTVAPAAGCEFVEYRTNPSIIITNNQFIMPNSDVTITAVFIRNYAYYYAEGLDIIAVENAIKRKADITEPIAFPDEYINAINSITFKRYYVGQSEPSSSLGENGDIYLQYE